GLMAGPESGPVVAVEVLVKQEVIAPMEIFLKLPVAPVNRTLAIRVPEKDPSEPTRDLFSHLEQGSLLPGTRGTFDGEIVAIVQMILKQRPNDQNVHGHPDRSPPVGIAAEHARVGLRRQVGNAIFLVPDMEDKRMLGMIPGERANAIRAEE